MAETNFLKGMSSHQRTNPISCDWLTPPEIIKLLGPFDLDPCTTCLMAHKKKPWVTAKKMYCKCDGGLTKRWKGRAWVNPPYGKDVGAWLEKLRRHQDGIALVFARTDTGWFHDSVFRSAAGIVFLQGRLRFYTPRGEPGDYTGGAPSALIAYSRYEATKLSYVMSDRKLRGKYVEL